jgi:acyl-CoA reductase-like NAD-dependent aldehyde dehydrogenase
MLKQVDSNYLISVNPAKNYVEVGKVKISTDQEITQTVSKAQQAKRLWKELGIKGRVLLLREILDSFTARQEELKKIIIEETGKTTRYAKIEFDHNVGYFKWFLENSERVLSDKITFEDETTLHRIVYEPRGVTAVITPWNHPFGMFVWGVIPNLLAGNTVVYKASEECFLSGKLIEKIMLSKNIPDGVFSEIYGAGDVGAKLTLQPVDFIWFTGSSLVGKKVYKIAAEKLIGAVMELGGSNPAIMFEDVNVDDFVEKIYTKRFSTCGQACDALKRLLIHESIFGEVVNKLKTRFEKIVVGDPLNEKTDIASLVAKRQADLLEDQVNDAVEKGAKIIVGGKRPEKLEGAYFLPTLLTNIKKEMRVWKEEVFGPVLIALPFKNEEEALALANETAFGLGSIIFTKDKDRANRLADRLETGNVEINGANHWLPCNPFGGYKQSGIGREHGDVGLQELCQIKLISEEK